MKKLVIISIVAAMLLASGAAFGQAASHDVEIRVPNVLMLRITNGSGSLGVASNPGVVFDFVTLSANVDAYLDAVNDGGDELAPTSVSDFDDVIVFSNRATWNVTVAADPIGFTDDVVTGLTANGIALSDITVAPSGTPGDHVSSVSASWSLATTTSIANGVRTQGWRSLGFSGSDYRLTVNGDENPGTYRTTVTYTIAAP